MSDAGGLLLSEVVPLHSNGVRAVSGARYPRSMVNDLTKLIKKIRGTAGWAVTKTAKQHHQVTGPEGVMFFLPGTHRTWDSHAMHQAVQALRRNGFPI